MKKKLNCILFIDDDDNCNFFHHRLLKKVDCTEQVHFANNGEDALIFLECAENGKYPRPAIIFLDINMPKMNGWEFLDAYSKLDVEKKGEIVIVMISTSLNPDDRQRAENHQEVKGFKDKYLTAESINETIGEFFPDYFGS
jgi:CheY-like chemotaxis protein